MLKVIMALSEKLALIYLAAGVVAMLIAMWRDGQLGEMVSAVCFVVIAWVTWPAWIVIDILDAIRHRKLQG